VLLAQACVKQYLGRSTGGALLCHSVSAERVCAPVMEQGPASWSRVRAKVLGTTSALSLQPPSERHDTPPGVQHDAGLLPPPRPLSPPRHRPPRHPTRRRSSPKPKGAPPLDSPSAPPAPRAPPKGPPATPLAPIPPTAPTAAPPPGSHGTGAPLVHPGNARAGGPPAPEERHCAGEHRWGPCAGPAWKQYGV